MLINSLLKDQIEIQSTMAGFNDFLKLRKLLLVFDNNSRYTQGTGKIIRKIVKFG